jgi:hypothetical protein
VATSTSIKHRLVQIQPPQDESTGKYEYDGIRQSLWLGNYVISAIVNSLLEQHSKQLESNFFGSQVHSIFQGDLKLSEIVALGCFALNPSHFKAVPLSQNRVVSTESGTRKKIKLNPPLIDTSLIAPFVGHVASSPKIKCVTNEAFARNIEAVGMASLLNVQYPGVDGVMHLRVKDEHNEEEWITAFLHYHI